MDLHVLYHAFPTRLSTDLVCLVLDPQIADRDGSGTRRIALLRAIRSRYRRLPIVVLVLLENPAVVRELLAIGVRAVVSKRSPSWELLVAVRRADRKSTRLNSSH